jgi:enoyl-CoA hydratase
MSEQPGATARLDERGVAIVTIDNTARLNALSTHVMETLIAAVEALERQPGLRAVVLRGAGERAFIGGADINEMATLDAQSARGFITLVHRSCDAIRRLPVPVIARLQGYAFGAGVEVAAACDIRIAAIGSQFGMPEVRLGIPSVVEAALLPQLIGWGRTRRLLLTGDTIDAATALAWGLVEEVAPIELLDQAIDRILDSILASGPQAIRLQKALIDAWEGLPLRDAIQRGIDSFGAAWKTDEPARMMQAYFASRSARRGR